MTTLIQTTLFSFFYFFVLILTVAGGYLIARYRYLKKERSWKASGIESGIIGFYGLLLSFALLQSGIANRERNTLIHQHADGIARLYRESDFLPDAVKTSVREKLKRILEIKIESEKIDRRELPALYAQTDERYNELWNDLTATYKKSADHGNVPELTNEAHLVTALDYRIRYSFEERTPLKMMLLLIVGSWMVGILVGFTNGFNESHHFLVPIIFILLTGFTVLTICDFDDPLSGLIRPSYENYKNLLKGI